MPTPLERRTRDQMIRDALAAMRESLAGMELSLEEIDSMTLDELLQYLESRGVTIDTELLDQQYRAQLGHHTVTLRRGMLPDRAAAEDIEARGERAVLSGVRAVAKQTVQTMHDESVFAADEREPEQAWYLWLSVGKGVCGSCHSLHGTVMAIDAWEYVGRPRDGNTLCGTNCRCKLIPVNATEADEGQRWEETRADLEPRSTRHG